MYLASCNEGNGMTGRSDYEIKVIPSIRVRRAQCRTIIIRRKVIMISKMKAVNGVRWSSDGEEMRD